MKYCILIDCQNDFLTGALANPTAVSKIPAIVDKVKELVAQGYKVIATRDTHYDNYMKTQEGKNLPVPHCIKGSKGWEVTDELKPFVDLYVDKKSFGFPNWKYAEDLVNGASDPMFLAGGAFATKPNGEEWFTSYRDDDIEPTEIAMMGFCTSICVASNFAILKASYPEIPITVYKDLCACVSPETHDAAIAVMKAQQAIIA